MGERFKGKYRVDSLRLNNYDYRNPGWYFVTICVKDKLCLFGEIKNGIVGLNRIGLKVFKNWHAIPDHFNHVQLDKFIVMPNHLHGLIGIKSSPQKRSLYCYDY